MATRTIKGETYRLILLKVLGRDEHGRPKDAKILYDENVEHIEGGEEYVTAFVPTKCVEKTRS